MGTQLSTGCCGGRSVRARGKATKNTAVPDGSHLLEGLDGGALSLEFLEAGLHNLERNHYPLAPSASSPPNPPLTVTGVGIIDGSENRFPTSHSGMLRLTLQSSSSPSVSEATVFLKKVTAAAMAHKKWFDRRKTLVYARTEIRFYEEFAPLLADARAGGPVDTRTVRVPRLAAVDSRLDKALGDTEVSGPAGEEPSAERLSDCGALLLLESVDPRQYTQCSPISEEQAVMAVSAAARFHARFDSTNNSDILIRAAERLQRHGGAFSLSIRNPIELKRLCGHWTRFVDIFGSLRPELFARPGVVKLGERLEAWSRWVSHQVSPPPEAEHATLIHGDYKAMNIFLPNTDIAGGPEEALLIDFASTGVGLGMADIGMLLSHSVAPDTLRDGGEERILDAYLDALADARGPDAAPYPRETAMRDYRLAVIDYGRFVVSRFWGDASPETFAKKAEKPNTTLVNRNVEAALAFVERIDTCLRYFEENESHVLQEGGEGKDQLHP